MMSVILADWMTATIQAVLRGSKEDKAASHERIVSVAAARIREAGVDQPSVSEIMRAAGLTHGGFYKHFGSRDDLIREAVEQAMADTWSRLPAADARDIDDPLAAFADAYLSTAHRDSPGSGCGVVALGAEVSRGDSALRDAYRAQIERYLAYLESLLGDEGDARSKAAVVLSAMVGSVLIARALGPTNPSDEILAEVREAVRERRLG